MKKQVILLVLTILAFTAVNAQNALQINLNKQKPLTVAGEDYNGCRRL